jgi:signal transduction histidine kinase
MDRPRPRRVSWPLILLAVSVIATGLAALQAYRTLKTQRAVERSVMRGYAHSASWSYTEHLNSALDRMAGEVLGSVHMGGAVHSSPPIPHAQDVPDWWPFDEDCFCHLTRHGPVPRTVFAFDMDADTIAVAVNYLRGDRPGWRTQERAYVRAPFPMASPAVRWVADTIVARHRARGNPTASFHFVLPQHNGTRYFFAYTLMPTAWGDTVIYGVEYSGEQFQELLENVFEDERHLPPVLQADLPTREILAIDVMTPQGVPLLQTEYPARRALWVEDTLPLSMGGLRVRASILPIHAERLLIGGTPKGHIFFLLLLLLLSAALAVVALTQMRREVALAGARSNFVSSVSHELRTPLAQIRLYLETLRLGRAADDATRAWSLDHIERETQRLGHLVENVLLFSRGAESSMLGTTEVRKLSDVVREIATEFEPLARSRRMNIDVDVAADAEAALKPRALRHVLLNLLDNATKYGPAGQTIRIAVNATSMHANLVVSDEGAGVAEAERERIWEPFQRGTTTAARAAGGSGVGLTIVRELMQSMGGRAWVETAGTGGAAFHIELPLSPHE